MASAPPLSNELHKIVIVLNGSSLASDAKRKLAAYYRYLKAVRALARKHGVRIVSKEIHLKQGTINKRKIDWGKEARRGGK
jgi:hypothetical protein